jgi:RNA polymerase sigma-70 factor (ECF subfamily)
MPGESALALRLVSQHELLKLKVIARTYVWGLPPDVRWEDLLEQALTRVLVGSRRTPTGINSVAFLAGIMRSLRTEYLRQAREARSSRNSLSASEEECALDVLDTSPSTKGAQLAALFVGDATVLGIIAGLGEGLSVEQVRTSLKLSKADCDAARKRIRRILLRAGLTSESEVRAVSPGMRLTATVDALAQELAECLDEEVIEAAKSLGMDPGMKESAAFAGLKYPSIPQLSDFFDMDAFTQADGTTFPSIPARPQRRDSEDDE